MRPVAGAAPMNICPAIFGSRNWAHASYNPKSGGIAVAEKIVNGPRWPEEAGHAEIRDRA